VAEESTPPLMPTTTRVFFCALTSPATYVRSAWL
jgi:hypothetical protein